ncbi:YaiI/YqxD family protein [soil metagenome]
MKIWVDADAAPRDVKDIVARAAARVEMPAVFVANQRLPLPLNNPHVTAEWVQGGPDVADQFIADNADSGDIAITADIPLAAILVEKGLVVLDPRGEQYSEENVRERLSIRDFMESLRGSGVETGGAKPYGDRDKQAFAAAFDRALTAALRRG